MGKPLPKGAIVDAAATEVALQQLSQLALDGYDLFALQALQASDLSQVISDDGDFCLVPSLTLFTANHNVVTAAQAQGKLIRR
jgi:hypothetical protein